MGPQKKNLKMLRKFTYIDTFMPIDEPKMCKTHRMKICRIFNISKINTYQPTKWPIGDLFKNPNQGI